MTDHFCYRRWIIGSQREQKTLKNVKNIYSGETYYYAIKNTEECFIDNYLRLDVPTPIAVFKGAISIYNQRPITPKQS